MCQDLVSDAMASSRTRAVGEWGVTMTPGASSTRRALAALFALFLILSAGIVTVGVLSFRAYTRSTRVEVEHQLAAIAELKVNELMRWRQERLTDGALLFTNSSFSALVRRALDNPQDIGPRDEVLGWLQRFHESHHYDEIRFFDAQGKTRFSVPEAQPAVSAATSTVVPEVMRSGKLTFQDFYRNDQTHRVHLAVLVPIIDDRNGRTPLGVLALRIDPGIYLYPFIQTWPIPSATAETLLVRREGGAVLFLNELRFRTQTALALTVPLTSMTLPAAVAASGREGVVDGVDYRGIPVLAALRQIPGSPWALVAKIDRSEFEAPVRARLRLMLLVVGALMAGAGAGVGLLWRHQILGFEREQLREAQERAWLQDVIARSLNEVYVFTPDTLRFRFVNAVALRNLGYGEAEMAALTAVDIKPEFTEEQFRAMVQPLLSGEREVLTFETIHRRKDGGDYPVEAHLQLVKLPDERVFLAVINDITERKKWEAELTRKNEELERFTYTISHDLKSPLVTVTTFLGFLEADIARGDAEKVRQDTGFIRSAAEKMSQLLGELLEMSRIGRVVNPPVTTTFREIIDEALTLVAGQIAARGVEIIVSDDKVALTGDRLRLVEIWQNLIENAVKYSGDQPAPHIDIGVDGSGPDAVFFVRDNGVGIDPRFQGKVFTLFERLDPAIPGTGLGLALVKRIVELNGGRISLESPGRGHGTCFRFTLPDAIRAAHKGAVP